VQLDRRGIGRRCSPRVRDRGPARFGAQYPREVGNEVFDRAAAFASSAFRFEDLDPGLRQAPEVGKCELGLGALGVHRPQLVERARIEAFDVCRFEQALYAFRGDSPVERAQAISKVSRR
jgi:hypothetical protein